MASPMNEGTNEGWDRTDALPETRGIGGHHRGHKGKTDEWLTPPALLAALGKFDLDPCAPPEPRPWTIASRTLTREQDGLTEGWQPWERVWLNPPYGPKTGKWLQKMAEHGFGIALIFARTETAMFFEWVWPFASAALFLEGRLHFHYPDGEKAPNNSGGPSVLLAYGDPDANCLRRCGVKGMFVDLRSRIVLR